MPNYSIGVSGLLTAQSTLELIGTNIANAATEGYHKQQGVLQSLIGDRQGIAPGGGVRLAGIRRAVDHLVEQQLLQQGSGASQAAQSLSALQSLEAIFGQTGSEPLARDLTAFLSSFSQLTALPGNSALQQQVVNSGVALVNDFRLVSQYIQSAQYDLTRQAGDLTTKINTLSEQVAELNLQVQNASNPSASNVLKDQRDQAIAEMSRLIGVQSQDYGDDNSPRNVYSNEAAMVTGTKDSALTAGYDDDGLLGLSLGDQDYFRGTYTGGKLGAVLELVNHVLPDLQGRLDTLAGEIARSVNELHVQGVGQGGSFAELVSGNRESAVSNWTGQVVAGSFYVRVIDQDSGQALRSEIGIDPDTDTLTGVAAKLSLVANLSASVSNGRLTIAAASGYKFDFLPALSAEPIDSDIDGTASPTISGVYIGSSNATYSVTVAGSGQVGIAADLHLEVRDGEGTLLKRFNVGSGYAAGDPLEIDKGILVKMGAGTLAADDTFDVQALASSDSSGFLAAAGLNTFFEGYSTDTLSVRQELIDDPSGLAVSTSQSMDDVDNLTRLAALIDEPLDGLGQVTIQEYLTATISGLGTLVATTQAKQMSLNQIVQQLTNQRDSASGVDVNEESARMLQFQRMYQALAKFITVQDQTVQYLMNQV